MNFRRDIWIWVLGITGLWAGNSFSANLEMRTSLGYDFISQNYFLDSVTSDTSLSVWLLKNNYLDDFKGRVALSYLPFDDRRLEFQSSYEQSSELFRARFLSDWKQDMGNSRFDLNSEFEWRNRYKGTEEFGDSYIYGYTRAGLSVPVTENVNGRFQMLGEFVTFDSISAYNYNYYRFGPKIGITRVFEGFSFLDANLFFVTRQVPDSSQLDYFDFGIDGSFFGMMEGGDIDLYLRLERKNYNRPDIRDDLTRFDFDGRGQLKMGQNYFTRIELNNEIVLYNSDDLTNFDYGRTGWAVLAGYEKNDWSAAFGPAFELMMEQEGTLHAAEDYFEIGGKIDFEVLKSGRFFGSIESVLGYRNLSVEEQYQSDFMFERINTLGNLQLWGSLNLNWVFSAEWEWHGISTENSEIFLLSTNLSYVM